MHHCPDFYDKKIADTMREHKHLGCAFAVKSLDEEGVFAGYASVFNVVDSQQDMILPGAFRQSIDERHSQIKLLWQHDMREPIGVIEELREDANGLYVRGRLMLSLDKAREAYDLLKEGVVKGLSIGYSPKRFTMEPDSGVRRLSDLDLWEISLVTFPANDAAFVTVIKSGEMNAREEKHWKQAHDAGQVMRLANTLDRVTGVLTR